MWTLLTAGHMPGSSQQPKEAFGEAAPRPHVSVGYSEARGEGLLHVVVPPAERFLCISPRSPRHLGGWPIILSLWLRK